MTWDINPAGTVDGEFMVCNGKMGHAYGLIATVGDEADARLISAAPDMLAALQDAPCPSTMGTAQEHYARFYNWLNGSAKAAIDKATDDIPRAAPTPLDHAWAAINALGGVPDKSDPDQVGYCRALDDALAALEKLGATDAAWRAGYPKGEKL